MLVRTDLPFTSARLAETLDELVRFSPFVHPLTIGTSRLGRPLYALVVGRGPRSVFFNAAHHANEWITSLILARFLEECARSCASSAGWADKVTLHCVPMVNPDGVDLVTGGIGRFRLAYREAEALAGAHSAKEKFPGCWKANICGVDLNSNYPAGWGLAKAHKFARGFTAPGPRDYVGPAPLSEPESCAMAAYTAVNDFALTLSLHAQGEEIYWRYRDFTPPGAEELARRLSQASGYPLCDVPDESSHAGYRDWFIETYNRPGFTVECGLGENPLPIRDFGAIYKKVAPLLWEALKLGKLI